MSRAETLLILAILTLTLAGVLASPVWTPTLIVLGGCIAARGWKRADIDELLRWFA